MPTLIQRTSPNGKTFWHLQFFFQGKPYKKSLGEIPELKARKVKEKVQHRLKELKSGFLRLPENVTDLAGFLVTGQVALQSSKDQKQEPQKSLPSYRTLQDSYLKIEEVRLARTHYLTKKIHLSHLSEFLGERTEDPISGITLADIESFILHRHKQVSVSTVMKEVSTIRHFFRNVVSHGYLPKDPTVGAPKFKTSGSLDPFKTLAEIEAETKQAGLSEREARRLIRFAYLKGEEIQELLSLAKDKDPWLYPIVTTLSYTGMRRGEVIRLEWKHIDFERRTVRAGSRKQSRDKEIVGRDIKMHDKLYEILAEQQKKNHMGRHVFSSANGKPVRPGNLHKRFKKLIEGTRFEGIGLHCLRHSFASNLAAHGVDQRLIDHYMGHQTEEMRKRYQHFFPQTINDAIHQLPY